MQPILSKQRRNKVWFGLALAFAVQSCVMIGPPRCVGAPPKLVKGTMVSGGDDPRNLRCWARTGDQVALYRLGLLYEFGDFDVPRDLKKAKQLYTAASKPRSGTTYVYSPPVGSETAGRVLPVRTGPDLPGLSIAKEALQRLGEDASSAPAQ